MYCEFSSSIFNRVGVVYEMPNLNSLILNIAPIEMIFLLQEQIIFPQIELFLQGN